MDFLGSHLAIALNMNDVKIEWNTLFWGRVYGQCKI